ncbi:MAG: glycosyltransferase family 4 protein [Alphaproteobacteria bacterium]|nr:glycosyltransferase family 4 protein [Alphaproteobacteria bacterium]
MTHCSSTILFYAPLSNKHNDHVSGDKIIAASFVKLFEGLGYKVLTPSTFSSRESKGLASVQSIIIDAACHEIERIEGLLKFEKPILWVTYHHYHKAPDLLGSVIAEKFNIPYMLIEASLNPAERCGDWRIFYPFVEKALQKADVILSLNPKDKEIIDQKGYGEKNILFPLMMQSQFFQQIDKRVSRQFIADKHSLDVNKSWILVVAQMREHKKYDSYIYLKESLDLLNNQNYELLIIGAGEKESVIRYCFSAMKQAYFFGVIEPKDMPIYYAASDIFAWPGLREAMGMVYLEAQSMGLPVVMDQRSGGRYFMQPNETGFVVHDNQEYAVHLDMLLNDGMLRQKMGRNAQDFVREKYRFEIAEEKMKECLVGKFFR